MSKLESFDVPILLVLFNRPCCAERVFSEVKKIKPEKLFVAIDGPRANNHEDFININKCKDLIKCIDWKCEISTLIREKNLGCKLGVSSAISWFFENVEHGIILEDDCLPSISFFAYSKHLLEKYRNNDSIMHINGVNFQNGIKRGEGTYYFSKVCHVWGWATWRRAWKKYDMAMEDVEAFFDESYFKGVVNYPTSYKYWSNAFLKTKKGLIDTWDYQWVYSIWKNNGLCIAPNFNFISNIGFDKTATHTKVIDERVSHKPLSYINTEINDCEILIPHYDADKYSFNTLFSLRHHSLANKIKRKIKYLSGKLIKH